MVNPFHRFVYWLKQRKKRDVSVIRTDLERLVEQMACSLEGKSTQPALADVLPTGTEVWLRLMCLHRVSLLSISCPLEQTITTALIKPPVHFCLETINWV